MANTIGSGYDDYKHIKGFEVDGNDTPHSAVPAGSISVYLLNDDFAERFNVGDDVLIGDGPGINEFFGEWVRVTGVSGQTISFTPPLQQNYASDKTCIVPGRLNPLTGRRQHMTDIVFRDLSICAPTSGTYAGQFGVVRAGVRIRFENVGLIKSPFESSAQTLKEIAFATCGDVTIRDGFYDGQLMLGPVQNAIVDNVVAGSAVVNEFSLGCRIARLTTVGTGGFTLGNGLGQRIHLSECVIRNYVLSGTANVAFAQDSVISNVQITHPGASAPPAFALAQNGLVLVNVKSDSAITLNGTGLRVDNLVAPTITLDTGSSGVLLSQMTVTDNSTAGSWVMPVQRRVKDRKVVSDDVGHVTLELMDLSGQTADLQQWQNSSGGVLAKVSKDGVFTIVGSSSKALSVQPGASPAAGIDMYMPAGGDVRLGSSYGNGALISLYSNTSSGSGQLYLDCGYVTYAAIIMRTGMGDTQVTRFAMPHGGPLVLSPPAYNGINVILQAAASQSANLLHCQDSSYAGLFGIRGDGNLATAKTVTGTIGSLVKFLPIYDMSNTVIGYIPIHNIT